MVVSSVTKQSPPRAWLIRPRDAGVYDVKYGAALEKQVVKIEGVLNTPIWLDH